MQRSVQSPKLDPRRQALSEAHGGTGAMNLPQAAKNLNLVTSDMLNAAGGVGGLDANLQLSNAIFPSGSGTRRGSISGPLTLVINTSTDFKITDFDMNKTYTLGVSSGSVSRNGDTISVVAPGATGSLTLTVNGQQYVFNVVNPHPARPSIISPTNGSLQRGQNVYVAGSAYASLGAASAQLASHWQVSTDPLFSTLTNESANDTVNLANWVFQAGAVSTTYYIRVRYQNNASQWSDWSMPVTIRTATEFSGALEEAKLTSTDANTNSLFGYSCAMNEAGDTLILGTQGIMAGGLNAAGAMYVFKRTGNSWSLFQKITSPNQAAVNRFGIVVICDSTATRIVAQEYSYQATSNGRIHIYTYNGSTYVLEQSIGSPNNGTDYNFGLGLQFARDGSRLFLGERGYAYSPLTLVGRVHVYLRSGTTWALEQTIDCPAAIRANSLSFGNGYGCDGTGTRLIIGCFGATLSGVKQVSYAYVYLRTGTVWALEQELVDPGRTPGDNYGTTVSMDATGTYAAVSAPARQDGTGAVSIFKRTGTVWTFMQTVVPVDAAVGWTTGAARLSVDGTKLLVGASGANFGATLNCGAAYVFVRNGELWTQSNKYAASDAASGDGFGGAIAGNADFTRFVSGAPTNDNQGVTNNGAAYVFS